MSIRNGATRVRESDRSRDPCGPAPDSRSSAHSIRASNAGHDTFIASMPRSASARSARAYIPRIRIGNARLSAPEPD
ncbi:hypothetical protein LFL97_20335 [Burkholderia sp. JSH-S8]|uniref:hypothetical protein n=1 Tax=Burkholderia stagnalis TaxID=1503054 RepID=UPI000F800971|nr:hypothetical protein [Burkholderia stagnalis]WGS45098.1 hypothetical protein LFL97_20335 [Burkholderia sp. JSH-S8]